jgi:hypothetical protein
MSFIKKKAKQIIFLSCIFLISFATEILITNDSFPKYTMSIFGIFIICSSQYYCYVRIRTILRKETKEITSRQDKINRNLMFAIEEIIDLQRDLISKKESVH